MTKTRRKPRCIIYGGAGFIGCHIAEELIRGNYHVTVFDKINASKKNVEHVLDKISFIEGDFCNRMDIADSLKNQDFAIHLVSSTLPADSNLNPVYDVETNIISSLNFFEECIANRVRKVVFISSGGTVYGPPVRVPIGEDHPTQPTNSYGITKLTIEKYLALYKNLKGLDYTVLRLSNPFGERQNPKLGQGLIAAFLYKIKNKKPIEVWGDGTIVRDFFYIKDGAEAIALALQTDSKYNVFNISSGSGLSINQVLEKFRKVLNLKFRVRYKPARRFDVQTNVLDNRRARKYLKWQPATGFDDALKLTWSYIDSDREEFGI
jgi:UDP-glucose 4-epimerase